MSQPTLNELGWWLCECEGHYTEGFYEDEDNDRHRFYHLVRPVDGGKRMHAADASRCPDCGTAVHAASSEAFWDVARKMRVER